jgi:hypothetical protein
MLLRFYFKKTISYIRENINRFGKLREKPLKALICLIFGLHIRRELERYNRLIVKIDDAILELNQRFKEHGVGYQFESGEIIRVDSEFLHTKVVKPTLSLLIDKEYQGANQEFLSAHKHYRHGRHEECLVDLLKAFESTMKIICKKRGWTTQPKDTASKLINILFQNNLLPSYLESEITCLRTLLESGVPTLRNKNAGHGQGAEIRTVPEYLARYALNLTASNILFLIEAESAR